MKKFKNILVGVIVAVTVVMYVVLPVGAQDFTLRKGAPSLTMSIIGAANLEIYCRCDSSSSSAVICRLRYGNGMTVLSFTVGIGEDHHATVTGLPPTTILQFVVSSMNGTNAAASGFIIPY